MTGLFEQSVHMHVRAHPEIPIVLFFQRAHVLVVAGVSETGPFV